MREIHLGEPSSRACMMAAACAVCPSTGTVLVAVIDVKKNRAHLAVCQYKVILRLLLLFVHLHAFASSNVHCIVLRFYF